MLSKAGAQPTATTNRWLSVVGIGEDGVDGLGAEARRLVGEAAVVFGGERHLALAAKLINGEARRWPSPFDTSMADLRTLAGSPVCVLASGDPFLFGVGATLAKLIPLDEMTVIPAASAFSLAAARLGWSQQAIDTVSLHGRPIELLRPLLHPGRRVLALTSDGEGPQGIAGMLAATGFGRSRLTVLEALGGTSERIRQVRADRFDLANVQPLNLVAIEVAAEAEARVIPLRASLPDALFENDGQLTKQEVRAITLSALAPRRGELLWDVGAGSGSIAIEWMLAHPSMRAMAIEADPLRAARIGRNAANLGVPGLRVVEGTAPVALQGLNTPDAIFIGGGGSDHGVMDTAMGAVRDGGRLVANAVTLEMEQRLLALYERHGGRLVRIAVSRVEPVGSMRGWRPAMPVTQWSWVKP